MLFRDNNGFLRASQVYVITIGVSKAQVVSTVSCRQSMWLILLILSSIFQILFQYCSHCFLKDFSIYLGYVTDSFFYLLDILRIFVMLDVTTFYSLYNVGRWFFFYF